MVIASILASAWAFQAATLPARSPGEYHEAIVVGGVTRRYLLRVPPGYDSARPAPLVILLHGWLSNAIGFEASTGFGNKADREGFLLAVPDGLGKPQGWNAGFVDLTGAHPDDIGFISSLLDRIPTEVAVDPKRIYVAGHSNGAMMTDYVGARLGNRIAAIAVVAGTIGLSVRKMIPEPVAPVSVLIIHGRRDGMVAYDSGAPALLKGISAPNSARWWARRDGCEVDATRTTAANGNLVLDVYKGGRDGTEVQLLSIRNGVHDWPGSMTPNGLERATGVNAVDLIWSFFYQHPRR